MAIKKLIDFLDRNMVRYITITHSPAFTAQELAETIWVPGKEVAKTVIFRMNGEFAMAVLPASHEVDFDRLKTVTRANVSLAEESAFANIFPECELGAMPPFGNLWSMPVFVSEAIAEEVWITFRAGSHREVVKMEYDDFERLARPRVADFSCKSHPSEADRKEGKGCGVNG